jgi:hypothetical protein
MVRFGIVIAGVGTSSNGTLGIVSSAGESVQVCSLLLYWSSTGALRDRFQRVGFVLLGGLLDGMQARQCSNIDVSSRHSPRIAWQDQDDG